MDGRIIDYPSGYSIRLLVMFYNQCLKKKSFLPGRTQLQMTNGNVNEDEDEGTFGIKGDDSREM